MSFFWSDTKTERYDDMLARKLLSNLQPRQDEELGCVAIMIYSSLQIKWFTVPCNHSFTDTIIFCQGYGRQPSDKNTDIDRQYDECPTNWVRIGSQCHRMVDLHTYEFTCNEAIRICHGIFSLLGNIDTTQTMPIKLLFYYYQWMNKPREDAFYAVENGQDGIQCLTLKLAQNPALALQLVNTSEILETTTATCATDLVLLNDSCLKSQFSCSDRSCILSHYICDGNEDCLDGSDEENCDEVCEFFHQDERQSAGANNCYQDCFPKNCTCSALYYQCQRSGGCIPASTLCDGNFDCVDGEDEMDCYQSEIERGLTQVIPDNIFTCQNGARIPQARVNDLIPDCPGGGGEDEPRLLLHWAESGVGSEVNEHWTRNVSCPNTFTQCIKGLPEICYPRDKICVYEVDSYSMYIKYCRNGAHLDNCSHHECPSMYKCRDSYCVPYHYVCNGRIDCPHGEDENNCSQLNCPGLLRCRHDDVCVHPDNIGDNITDCLLSKDDETLLSVDRCPESCKCIGNAATCVKLDFDLLKLLWHSLRKLKIRNQIEDNLCLKFPQLVILDLSKHDISPGSFPKFCFLPELKWLRLVQSGIRILTAGNLRGLPKLRSLELQNNPTHTIDPFCFSDLNRLRILNISHANITKVDQTLFHGLDNLVTLDLSYNPITDIHHKGFVSMSDSLSNLHIVIKSIDAQYTLLDITSTFSSLENLYVYPAAFCRYISSNVGCHFVISVEDTSFKLIGNLSMELSMWFFGTLLALSHFVAGMFWIYSKAPRLSKLLLILISVYSIGLSLYPLYILVMHHYYDSYFLFYRSYFVTTLQCNLVGKLFIWCHLTCLFTVLLTSHHRYILIAYPFTDVYTIQTRYFVSLLLFTVTLLAVVASYDSISGNASPASTCHIMPTEAKPNNWPYILGVLLSSDCLLHGTIIVVYVLTSFKLKSAANSSIQAHGRAKVKSTAYRRSICFCAYESFSLLISCIIQVLAVKVNYSNDGILASILALLLYELINPMLYTFSTSAFRELLRKYIMHMRSG